MNSSHINLKQTAVICGVQKQKICFIFLKFLFWLFQNCKIINCRLYFIGALNYSNLSAPFKGGSGTNGRAGGHSFSIQNSGFRLAAGLFWIHQGSNSHYRGDPHLDAYSSIAASSGSSGTLYPANTLDSQEYTHVPVLMEYYWPN